MEKKKKYQAKQKKMIKMKNSGYISNCVKKTKKLHASATSVCLFKQFRELLIDGNSLKLNCVVQRF